MLERLARYFCRAKLVRFSVCSVYTLYALFRNRIQRFRNRALPVTGPLVSVVVPVGALGGAYETMRRSLKAQRYLDLEIIEIDDTAHRGAGWARNQGLAKAHGKYVIFLDSDDFFEPTLIQKLVFMAEKDSLEIAMCFSDRYEQNWRLFSPMNWSFLKKPLFTPTIWVKLFRRDFIERSGVEFQEIPRSNDIFFSFALAALASRYAITREVLVHYRSGQSANLQSGNDETPTSFFEALKGLEGFLRKRGLFDKFRREYEEIAAKTLAHNLKVTTGKAHLKIIALLRPPKVRFLGIGPRIGGGATYIRRKLEEWGAEIDEKNPDIIHINHLRSLIRWYFTPFKPAQAPVTFVVHGVHLRKYDFLSRTLKNRIFRFLRLKLEAFLYRRVNELIVLNHADEAFLRENHGLKGRIKVEPNHVPVISTDSRKPNYAFIMVARFDFPKGQDIAVKAIALAAESLRAAKAKTLFIGDGPTMKEIRSLVEKSAVSDLVEFRGEIENAAAHLWEGETLLAPSRWEGSPYAVLEARAAHKRIIASDCAGNREALRDYELSTLVATDDSSALAKAIIAETGRQASQNLI